MRTYTTNYGSTITIMTPKETGIDLNNGCLKYREISTLMESHGMTREEAIKTYNENLAFAEEMGW